MFILKFFFIRFQFDTKDIKVEEEQIIPPPPPGSPPPNLPQPTLKNPEKFIVNQLIFFHYNIHTHEIYVSPFHYPTHDVQSQHSHQQQPQHQQTPPPTSYSYKSNAKLTKSNRVPSSKHFHSSSHKSSLHNPNENNLIILSNSPSNI